ncbi:BREX system ATP-binding domain-containing protein [Streptomyces sp. E11-3]|uniref:BREX system ATP-binding domain-containing protein n=1 Tax=Streptomyces sp. E11-3 TaxID=3110112 RepID=UPI00397F5C4F
MELIERSNELNLLEEALSATVSGGSRIVLIEGAVGCGKSVLIDAVAERAASAGCAVLRVAGSPDEREVPLGVLRQLSDAASAAGLPPLPVPPRPESGPRRVESTRELRTALREAATATPVVCCVDDLHHVDDASLHALRRLAQSTDSARILLVFAGSPYHAVAGSDGSVFGTELLRHPGFRRIRLSPLSPEGVALALRDQADVPANGEEAGYQPHVLTGGNPLLLRALLEDRRFAAPGGLFAQAVSVCLRRIGPGAQRLAQALAVLGDDASPERAGRLLELSAAATARAADALATAGMLADGRFRAQVATAAALEGLAPDELAVLHRRAAQVLHADCAPIGPVAGHLIASATADAPWTDVPWAADVLGDHAEQLLAKDAGQQALSVLNLAREAAVGEERRADITARLASVTWRFNPAAAERKLSAPLEELRAGGGCGAWNPASLARLLVEQGRISEALDVNRRLAEAAERPGAAEPLVAYEPVRTAFWAVPDAPGNGAAGEPEQLLGTTVLTAASLHPLVHAIRSLTCSAEPERALAWCQKLQEEAAGRGAPGWSSVFATLHAEVLLHLGDLRGAEEEALAAVDGLPERGGSAFALAPTAALVRARTLRGKHTSAARLLDRPIRDELLHSVPGLAYLRARGLHSMASSQFHAALADFLDIGRLVKRWHLDRPALLPWRTDAADALIRIGEPQQAERLIAQQMASPDAQWPRVRGLCLRMRAAIAEPRQRATLLEQAVDELRRSGDRIETARALAALGQALQSLGESGRASTVTRRAWNLAHVCGAEALREEIMPGLAPESAPPAQPPVGRTRLQAKLSDSERRVAALAAHGYTNREISLKLYVTVSTVEQHLTRVYRKLSISRRQDLPIDLQLNAMEMA